jgi:hypothetical protein
MDRLDEKPVLPGDSPADMAAIAKKALSIEQQGHRGNLVTQSLLVLCDA